MSIGFENYTNDAFLALPWYVDFQNNDNINKGGWATVLKEEALANKMTIAGNVASFKLDVTELGAGGYTMHFGLKTGEKAPEYKPAEWTAQEPIENGHMIYQLVCHPGSNEGTEYWGCVGLTIIDKATASIASASVSGTDAAVITMTGTGENIDNTMFRADIQSTYDWQYPQVTSETTVVDGAWTIVLNIPGTVANGDYLVHWFLGDHTNDLEKKADLLPDFQESSTTVSGKSYSLHISNMWNRDMIVLTVADAA
jgi:hypothetical protein